MGNGKPGTNKLPNGIGVMKPLPLLILVILIVIACGGGAAPTTARPAATSAPQPTPTTTKAPEPSATPTPEPASKAVPEPTATTAPEPTAIKAPEPTATKSPEPIATIPPTAEPTDTPAPAPTDTPTPEPLPTATPAPPFDGEFLLFVQQPADASFTGKTVLFKVDELTAAETATWQQGGVDELSMTALSEPPGYTGELPREPGGFTDAAFTAGGLLASPVLQPLPPHVFKGTVTIDRKPAPENTAVTAWIDGVQVPGAEATVQAKLVAAGASLGPVGEALKPLVDNLVRVWKFDAATQDWSFYDPRPGFGQFNTLRAVASGEFYWVVLKERQTATLNGQNRTLVAGWNPLAW